MPKSRPDFLSTGEASKLLGTSSQTIINYTKDKTLKSSRVGKGRRLIHKEELFRFIKANKIKYSDNPLLLDWVQKNFKTSLVEKAISLLRSKIDKLEKSGSDYLFAGKKIKKFVLKVDLEKEKVSSKYLESDNLNKSQTQEISK